MQQELIAEGGIPVRLDLTHKHGIFISTSRGGKSAVASATVLAFVAQGVPVAIIDRPNADADSTFTHLAELLPCGTNIDVLKTGYNLAQLPDLRHVVDAEQRQQAEESCKKGLEDALLIASVGASPENQEKAKNIKDILSHGINAYWTDPAIQHRHQQALAGGPDSPAWAEMPTLIDLIEFFTPALLAQHGLEFQAATDALETILMRLKALLHRRIGKALATPHWVPKDNLLLVFALTEVTDPDEMALLCSLVMQAAQRQALELSGPQGSLIVIDEAPIIFKYPSVTQAIANLVSNGLKASQRCLILSQTASAISAAEGGQQILQNISARLIGFITRNAVPEIAETFGYDPNLLLPNAEPSYMPNKLELYSRWFLDVNGHFNQVRFYPAHVLLAMVSNNADEKLVRRQFIAAHPGPDDLHRIAAYAEWYTATLRRGVPLLQAYQAYQQRITTS